MYSMTSELLGCNGGLTLPVAKPGNLLIFQARLSESKDYLISLDWKSSILFIKHKVDQGYTHTLVTASGNKCKCAKFQDSSHWLSQKSQVSRRDRIQLCVRVRTCELISSASTGSSKQQDKELYWGHVEQGRYLCWQDGKPSTCKSMRQHNHLVLKAITGLGWRWSPFFVRSDRHIGIPT